MGFIFHFFLFPPFSANLRFFYILCLLSIIEKFLVKKRVVPVYGFTVVRFYFTICFFFFGFVCVYLFVCCIHLMMFMRFLDFKRFAVNSFSFYCGISFFHFIPIIFFMCNGSISLTYFFSEFIFW